jgi:hypothetical protein
LLQELLAGAIDEPREKLVLETLVEPFERRGRLITPSYASWKAAGLIMARLVQRKLLSPGGFKRSFQAERGPNGGHMSTSPEQRIEELEAALKAAKAEIKKLNEELAAARLTAANARKEVETVRNEATKRMLEERNLRR